MFGIEAKVEKAARKAAAFSVGGLLAAVGLGFLTVAAWLVLAELRSTVFAATVIGAAYLGVAAIIVAWGMSRPKSEPKSHYAHQGRELSPLQLIVVSFIQGLEEGRKARR